MGAKSPWVSSNSMTSSVSSSRSSMVAVSIRILSLELFGSDGEDMR